ncbi:HepT-like ribonuclease domain-containing protein [Thermophilibacter mediterraneus]|uniref:HepT-like ribonuclease domain-containing protein n=1 Tax=Thermophilibacter mediterraneus TaxID=1871031 RepID=UPI002357E880|nr:HepT-like ribonuclease domain-containing protein [Thermophilibacter mediterraneus]
MKQPDRHVLERIVDEISYLERLLDGMSMEGFVADETVKRAAAMASINIGELAKHLSDDFYKRYPGSELRYAARTRDVYAHGYYTLRFETVYKTARDDYPRVKAWILEHLDD